MLVLAKQIEMALSHNTLNNDAIGLGITLGPEPLLINYFDEGVIERLKRPLDNKSFLSKKHHF